MELLRMSTAANAATLVQSNAGARSVVGSNNNVAAAAAVAALVNSSAGGGGVTGSGAGGGGGGGHRKLERTQSEPLPQQVNTSRYKTELCRPFEEAGECKYGDKCQFAHGMQELRNLQRHPKYKTELCRTFHSVGFCPYGPRCHFVHNAEEARNHNRSVAAYHAAQAAAAAAAAAGNSNNGQSHQQSSNVAVAAAAALQQAQLQQTAAALLQQHKQHQQQQQQQHQLPLSPALSMSTGSDRASPIGSLSLSPTTSMASFFPEQGSPTFPPQPASCGQGQGVAAGQGAFNFPASPPASPIDGGHSPLTSTPPPPSPSLVMSSSCPPVGKGVVGAESVEARLPVFNRLSSAVDAFNNMMI